MPSLPTQGGSAGTWGTELNAFLSVALDSSTGNPKVVQSVKSGPYTLAGTDNGTRIVVTSATTITVPAPGTLTNNFECEIVNDSGGSVILDGSGSTNVTMADGEVAIVMEVNGKTRVAKGSSTVIS
jgi:hypothetical protein